MKRVFLFKIYLHTKYHVPGSSESFIISIQTES